VHILVQWNNDVNNNAYDADHVILMDSTYVSLTNEELANAIQMINQGQNESSLYTTDDFAMANSIQSAQEYEESCSERIRTLPR
jgi:hypothetical protein